MAQVKDVFLSEDRKPCTCKTNLCLPAMQAISEMNIFDPEVDIKCEILMLLVTEPPSDSFLETFCS